MEVNYIIFSVHQSVYILLTRVTHRKQRTIKELEINQIRNIGKGNGMPLKNETDKCFS